MSWMENMMRAKITALLCALALLLALPFTANAAESSDANEPSITVYAEYGTTFIPGMEVSLHRVGAFSDNGAFVPLAPYAGYSLSWDVSTSTEAKALATTLKGYIARDGISPYDVALTDANGVAVFPKSASSLPSGYYLILGEAVELDGVMVEPAPSLVSFPSTNAAGEDDYSLGVLLKFETNPADSFISLTVAKVWKGDSANGRPSSIKADLVCDGKVVDTVVLNAANGWRFTWEDLSTNHMWDIVESSIPNDYELSITKDGRYITMTNEGNPPENPPELPQTGQLWWPVPLLAGAGFVLLAFGVVMRRRA